MVVSKASLRVRAVLSIISLISKLTKQLSDTRSGELSDTRSDNPSFDDESGRERGGGEEGRD